MHAVHAGTLLPLHHLQRLPPDKQADRQTNSNVCSDSFSRDSDQTHTATSSIPGHPEAHMLAHTQQAPSVTLGCCCVSTKNNRTQLLL